MVRVADLFLRNSRFLACRHRSIWRATLIATCRSRRISWAGTLHPSRRTEFSIMRSEKSLLNQSSYLGSLGDINFKKDTWTERPGEGRLSIQSAISHFQLARRVVLPDRNLSLLRIFWQWVIVCGWVESRPHALCVKSRRVEIQRGHETREGNTSVSLPDSCRADSCRQTLVRCAVFVACGGECSDTLCFTTI